MWKFIVKRIMLGILIIVLGSMVSYAVVRSLPTSFVDTIAQQRSQLPGGKSYDQWKEELNAVYGLDKSIIEGYLQWGGNALRGDWGDSWHYNVPVLEKFGEVIGYTVGLNLITLFLQIIICIPLGILAARKQYSKTDYA
ncbi:MAG: ABC transporter permease, partial [Clostridiales bacterium]|nr:ABC transporter permease [Clostridiales bacterium]